MHPIIKYLVNAIVDDKPIRWDEVELEIQNLNLSKRERAIIYSLQMIHKIFKFEIND